MCHLHGILPNIGADTQPHASPLAKRVACNPYTNPTTSGCVYTPCKPFLELHTCATPFQVPFHRGLCASPLPQRLCTTAYKPHSMVVYVQFPWTPFHKDYAKPPFHYHSTRGCVQLPCKHPSIRGCMWILCKLSYTGGCTQSPCKPPSTEACAWSKTSPIVQWLAHKPLASSLPQEPVCTAREAPFHTGLFTTLMQATFYRWLHTVPMQLPNVGVACNPHETLQIGLCANAIQSPFYKGFYTIPMQALFPRGLHKVSVQSFFHGAVHNSCVSPISEGYLQPPFCADQNILCNI